MTTTTRKTCPRCITGYWAHDRETTADHCERDYCIQCGYYEDLPPRVGPRPDNDWSHEELTYAGSDRDKTLVTLRVRRERSRYYFNCHECIGDRVTMVHTGKTWDSKRMYRCRNGHHVWASMEHGEWQ